MLAAHGDHALFPCMSGRSEIGQSLPSAPPAQDGVCNKACYPPGEKREGGDWSSRDPVCASGITFMNRAEAMVGGRACRPACRRAAEVAGGCTGC